MNSKDAKIESRMVVPRGWGSEELVRKMLVKGYKLAVRRLVHSENLMRGTMVMVNYCIMYLKVAERLNLNCFHHNKKAKIKM